MTRRQPEEEKARQSGRQPPALAPAREPGGRHGTHSTAGTSYGKLTQAQFIGVALIQPLDSAVPQPDSQEPWRIIHNETMKLADEKLAVVERFGREAGVQVEAVRQSHDHSWEAIVQTATKSSAT